MSYKKLENCLLVFTGVVHLGVVIKSGDMGYTPYSLSSLPFEQFGISEMAAEVVRETTSIFYFPGDERGRAHGGSMRIYFLFSISRATYAASGFIGLRKV